MTSMIHQFNRKPFFILFTQSLYMRSEDLLQFCFELITKSYQPCKSEYFECRFQLNLANIDTSVWLVLFSVHLFTRFSRDLTRNQCNCFYVVTNFYLFCFVDSAFIIIISIMRVDLQPVTF